MQYLRRNPLVIWIKWWQRTRKHLKENEGKNLKIGHHSYLNNTELGNYVTIYDNVILQNCVIGDYVYIQDGARIANTTFGRFCSIGHDVKIGLGIHPVDFISTFPAFYSTKLQCQVTFADKDSFKESGKVEIGNDVWIGANALIMDNVKIGDGAIIAAGAVVTKNVDPYTIVGGVPASAIKKRFTEDQISRLLEYKWWEKDPEWLKKNHKLFHKPPEFFKLLRRELQLPGSLSN